MVNNLHAILHDSEYAAVEGRIIEVNSYLVKLCECSTQAIHVIDFDSLSSIELAPDTLPPDPCIFSRLPFTYPPFCFTCSPKPYPLILELFKMMIELPPTTNIILWLSEFNQVNLQLQNIYQINNTFIFICPNAQQISESIMPIAVSISCVHGIDILTEPELLVTDF